MNNWQTKKLGEVSTISSGATPSRMKPDYYLSGTIPWVKSGELTNGDVNYTEEFITHKAVNDARLKILPQGTPILAMYGATAGTAAMLNIEATTNQAVAAIQPDIGILEPKYTFYFLKFKKSVFLSKRLGGAQPNISQKTIKSMRIPVPPLSAQQQIVEKLDAIRKLQELNQKEIEKTEELLHSYLARAFKSQTGGEIKKLGDLFMRRSKTILPITLGDKLVNYIGLENIESNTGRLVIFSECSAKTIKSTKTKFSKGDTLYGKLRPYLNKVWLATMDGICSTDIWVLKAQENEILPKLLPTLLRFPEIVKKTLACMTGTNLPRVNPRSFDDIRVTILPIEKQKILVEEVVTVQAYQLSLQTEKEKLSQLFDSALNKFMNNKQYEQ